MKYLTAILIIFPFIVFAQENNVQQKESEFSIGGSFSLDYCYRQGVANNSYPNALILSLVDDIDIPKFGFTTGVDVFYRLSDRFSLQSGILFSQKGYASKVGPLTFTAPMPYPAPTKIYFNDKYEYMDISLMLKFYFNKNKIKVFLAAGGAFNIFIRSRSVAHTTYEDGTKDRNAAIVKPIGYDFNKITISANLGAGVEYSISQRLDIVLQPIFRYQLIPIVDSSIKYYLYSGGIITGIIYKFYKK